MRLVVTGAAGYLGRHVMAIAPKGTLAFGHQELDLLDPLATNGSISADDIVIHCAAHVPKTSGNYDDDKTAYQNVTMVENLVAARPQRLIFASSMAVYADDGKIVRREEDAGGKLSAYGQAKLTGEEYLRRSDVPYTALRLAGLFGLPRRGGLLYNTVMAISNGDPITLPERAPLWAPLAVEDAADLCVRAAQNDEAFGPCNVGYEGRFSVSRTVSTLFDHFGKSGGPEIQVSEPLFEFNLSRLNSSLGKPANSFLERIDKLHSSAS